VQRLRPGTAALASESGEVGCCVIAAVRSTREAGSGHEGPVTTCPMLDALQVLSSSQVTPGLSMSMRIRPICKVYIQTYPSCRRRLNWRYCWQGQELVVATTLAGGVGLLLAGLDVTSGWRYCADAGWGCCVAGWNCRGRGVVGSWAGL
jgi:hypothetical protein